MTTTLAQLRASLRHTLNDATVWKDSLLSDLIKDAIRDYSSNFPYETGVKIDCTAGTRVYDLATPCGYIMNVLSIEYPKGQDPKQYLTRKPEDSSGFQGGTYYDLRGDPTVTLIIGPIPLASDDIQVTYTSMHPSPASDATALTVPDEHLEVLRLYVMYRCMVQLETDHSIDVDRRYQVMSQMVIDSKTAWNRYRSKVSEVRRWQALGGYVGGWKMDKKDRSY